MLEPIICLLSNRKITYKPGVPFQLSSTLSLREIEDAYWGAICKYDPKIASSLTSNFKALIINSDTDDAKNISDIILSASFSINCFRHSGSLSHGRVFTFSKNNSNKIRVKSEITEEIVKCSNISLSNFSLDKSTSIKTFESLFESSKKALNKEKILEVSLQRYNLSVSSSDDISRIIDMSIAAESLLPAQSEISFQLAMYAAIIFQQTNNVSESEAYEVFKLMKKFYSNRSKIVHGSSSSIDSTVKDQWEKIVSIIKLMIIYKVEYIVGSDETPWKEHLDKLAIRSAITLGDGNA